jgi:hypothetical protein
MLSDLRCQSASIPAPEIRCDDRYSRSMEDDMKEAIALLFKLKAGLDKLHPECTRMIERMMTPYNRF